MNYSTQFLRPIVWPDGQSAQIISLRELALAYPAIARYPVALRIMLEAAIRKFDGKRVTEEHILRLLAWHTGLRGEIPFCVSRVLLQDSAGIPLLGDLAAMRTAASRHGITPEAIEPGIPVDLVIDHSVIVDEHGSKHALQDNIRHEYRRNQERYSFVKWAQQAFKMLRVVPPGYGIVHQINLEYLATVIVERAGLVFPDTLVGTDSHTTMVNGLGILGWGVGGLEAESALLGEPLYLESPEVVAVVLDGQLPQGTMATDLALHLTHALREYGVVGKLLEFTGKGARSLSVPDRATVANMAPEYGATTGFFPVDDTTLAYLRLTGRAPQSVERVRTYYQSQGMFGIPDARDIDYSSVFRFDLSALGRVVSGPSRPQQKMDLSQVPGSLPVTANPSSCADALQDGDIVLAAITSCTNTSNPDAMVAAGLLAKAAVARGLRVPKHVKTVLAPGSRAVTQYLTQAGLLADLEALGFYVAAYGCAVCVGNSGDLAAGVEQQIEDGELIAASILSGNRNFEGRIHRAVKANYLASPALVVAYALAGSILRDLDNEPLGNDSAGIPVFLRDIWPDDEHTDAVVCGTVEKAIYHSVYAGHELSAASEWAQIEAPCGPAFQWQQGSTYFVEPPFFDTTASTGDPMPITDARVLAVLGDSVTTDHISPVGEIPADSAAGVYLRALGVDPEDFNNYGSRRCNHHVMMRGTFANPRLQNKVALPVAGPVSRSARDRSVQTIYDVAMENMEDKVPSIIFAGTMYGAGSARDWAAKGTRLLGVRAIIAGSFERIHRSNLILMGVLPVEVADSLTINGIAWTGSELVSIELDGSGLSIHAAVKITVKRGALVLASLAGRLRIDTSAELRYLHAGGILPFLYRQSIQ